MKDNNKNVIIACVLSAMILIGWTWFFEKPRVEEQQRLAAQNATINQQASVQKSAKTTGDQVVINNDKSPTKVESNIPSAPASVKLSSRDDVLKETAGNRIKVQTPELHGSINLKGLVFDDLTLVNYKETLTKDSKEVTLLSPNGSNSAYFVNFGYVSSNTNIAMPNENSIWKASNSALTPENPVIFTWTNNQKITFEVKVEVDEHYMFKVSQNIKNNSGANFEGFLNTNIGRYLPEVQKASYILHEGPVGVFDGILHEKIYDDVKKKKEDNTFAAKNGWFGITDKYWLVSIAPDKNSNFETKFLYENKNYYANYQNDKFIVESGKSVTFENYLFAGAKKVSLLDDYAKKYGITRFDLAIDFGWYYFLTKPFFFILQFFSKLLGNYGLAILALTIFVKLAMFPLANKSFTAMAKIKQLSPKLDKIRENFKGKPIQMNKEIMELYKREKVNPVSGCLPMLIQIPVFFSLYKVLYVTIDMRHAPFYGWIHDLSAPDPTSIFNLFGLLPFEVHGILAIGIWPILMGATMIIQQSLNPAPSDPVQAKVLRILPFILIFVFATFPAGLLIYWTWSNILSITQQYYIAKKLNAPKAN